MAHLQHDLHQDPELANIIAQSIKEYDEQQLKNIQNPDYYKYLSDDDLDLKRVLEQTQNPDTDLTSALEESLAYSNSNGNDINNSNTDIAFDMAIQESIKLQEAQLKLQEDRLIREQQDREYEESLKVKQNIISQITPSQITPIEVPTETPTQVITDTPTKEFISTEVLDKQKLRESRLKYFQKKYWSGTQTTGVTYPGVRPKTHIRSGYLK